MLRAYCIRRAGDPAPDPALRGVDGAAVRLIEEGDLGVWLSGGGPLPATAERLREHDAVVRAALRSVTPLPVRFGTTFPDEAAAARALRERRDELVLGLERVAGRVEVGVQVRWRAAEAPPAPHAAAQTPHSGTEYLARRRDVLRQERAARARAGEALARVEAAFAPLALPTVRTVVASAEVAGTLAQLVQRDQARTYREHAAHVRDRLPELDLAFSGPWAPYSFV